MQIAVAGLGYVGMAMACLLCSKHPVVAVDVDQQRVDLVNAGILPFEDDEAGCVLAQADDRLVATIDAQKAYASSDLIVIATPTDYQETTATFDTSSIESILTLVANTPCPHPPIVIKSTVPVGYTARMKQCYPNLTLLFSPEFLREGHALYDNLHPSRIIVGMSDHNDRRQAEAFATLLQECALDRDVPTLVTNSSEAEAVKLFANTYLALRVAFFNELDTYAECKGLNAQQIIQGVSLDPRIGDHYNNPSFGYGGYCLPKDSKQLLSNYQDVPQTIIRAIVESNDIRKHYIAQVVAERQVQSVGIYRLVMKTDSDNLRHSSTIDVVKLLQDQGVDVFVYEPTLSGTTYNGFNLCSFGQLSTCDLILANRWNSELEPLADRIYTRDLWQRD